MAILTPADLTPFATIDAAKAQAMIDDLTAEAYRVAPCLKDENNPSAELLASAKAVLRQAALRWNDAGSGVKKAWTRGPFGEVMDTTQPRKAMFWPAEINTLLELCSPTKAGKAFMIDMTTLSTEGADPLELRPDLKFQYQLPYEGD